MHIPSKKYIGARHKIMVETEKRGDVRIRKGRKGLERGEGEKKKKSTAKPYLQQSFLLALKQCVTHVTTTRAAA